MSLTVTPQKVINQLSMYLPVFTDLFSELIDVAAAESISADTVRVTTNTDHGLVPGSLVIVKSGLLRNSITSVGLNTEGTLARFTTLTDHDFTAPMRGSDPDTLDMIGFTLAAWNGTHKIIDVPNRKNFVIPVPEGETLTPALTGSERVLEDRPSGLKGVWPVINVPSTIEFDLQYSNVPVFPINPVTNFAGVNRIRIGAAADLERAEAAYSKVQGSGIAWLYLIMGEHDISKDRETLNDSIATFANQDEAKLLIMQNFWTVAFIDTSDSETGAAAQELVYGEIYEALLKTLFGFRSDNNKSQFSAIPAGHGVGKYNSSYYTQVYNWQLPQYIDWTSGFSDPKDVAFRNIHYILRPFDLENPDAFELKINLDAEAE